MDTLLIELRHAVRSLRATLGLAITAGLALALGVGVTTTMFSAVDQLLVRPLPYPSSDRLMWIDQVEPLEPRVQMMLSQPRIDELKAAGTAGVFESTSLFMGTDAVFSDGDSPARITGSKVDSMFFRTMRVGAAIGRTLEPEEDRPGGAQTIVLSDALWRTRFGADPRVLGTRIRLDTASFEIVGVMPPSFNFPQRTAYWISLVPATNPRTRGCVQCVWAVGRLRDAVTVSAARARLQVLADGDRAGDAALPPFMRGMRNDISSLRDWTTQDARAKLLVLFASVCCVLLIACANVANLLLARATARRREFAVRAAIGASRARIIRQVLVEAAVLALPAAVVGMLLAAAGVKLMVAFIPQASTIESITVDGRVMAFAAIVALIAAFGAALWPALSASAASPGAAMRDDHHLSGSIRRNRFRSGMVITQVATTFVLLAAAALLGKSFTKLISTDAGFQPDRLVTMTLRLARANYSTDAARIAFRRALMDRLSTLPGVNGAAISTGVPFAGAGMVTSFAAAGDASRSATGPALYTTDGLFSVLGTRLLAGRQFARGDSGVVVINQAAAAKLFPGTSALGGRVTLFGDTGVVVGVVADMRFQSRKEDPMPQLYLPIDRQGAFYLTVTLRTTRDDDALPSTLRAIVHSVDPRQPVDQIATMSDLLADSVKEPRTQTLLLGAFGLIAFLMACLGVYGVVSYSVTQRTREIGVRVALGASRRSVMDLVVGQGLMLGGVGCVLGAVAALWATRLVASSLYGVKALDPWVFASTVVVMLVLTLLASYLPARRATRIDPIIALRAE